METKITAKTIGLKEDFDREKKALLLKSNRALFGVGVELKNELQEILREEWYRRYKPTTYERRTDNNSLGRPIGDDENFDVSVRRQVLEFSFNPIGTHANPEWSQRNGDDLIKWIQQEHNYAESENGEIVKTIPSRPFWNNFLDRQMDGGIIEKFITQMSPEYIVKPDGTDNFNDLATEYLPEDIVVHKI